MSKDGINRAEFDSDIPIKKEEMDRRYAKLQAELHKLRNELTKQIVRTEELQHHSSIAAEILRRPAKSYLITRLARFAAKIPWLPKDRRQKFLRSANKRDLQRVGQKLSETLHIFNSEVLPDSISALKVSTFLGGNIEQTKLKLIEHSDPVDIIVCVHNALDDIRACLSSIVEKTTQPFRLIIVDDGSALDTKQYLEGFASSQGAVLLRNNLAGGYTKAANKGLIASNASWVVLLNSDVIVSSGWLDEMLKIGNSDSLIGIVGPSSNAASWQSVPELLSESNDWSDNPLPDGVTIDDMKSIVNVVAPYQGIDLPFINGFAFMMRRELINDIGIFDEDMFGAGYGEENDYCIRVRKAGWKLIFAANAYVFHAQSKSYSTTRRLKLAEAADKQLRIKHDEATKIIPQLNYCQWNLAALSFRARVADRLKHRECLERVKQNYGGKRVAFVLSASSAGGGSNVIVQESSVLRSMGVDTWIINLAENQSAFEKAYRDFRTPVLYFDTPMEVTKYLKSNPMGFDAVIASAYFTVNWLPKTFDSSAPKLGYYIQDYEPYFFDESQKEYSAALKTYHQLDRIKGFTKTEWNADMVANLGVKRPHVIGASVDLERFRPKGRNVVQTKRIRIVTMVRFDGNSNRRAPELTVNVINRLAETYRDRVEIVVFGTELKDQKNVVLDRDIITLGVLTPSDVASLLQNSDVFLDFSVWQAMGLSAAEAMASGCAVIVPERGGAIDFCRHEVNALVIDTSNEEACFAAASRLVEDDVLRHRLRKNATTDICEFSQQRSASRMIDMLFREEN